MSHRSDARHPSHDGSILRQVDPIADKFDSAWQAALEGIVAPRVEDHLGESSEPLRSALLRELIAIDVQYRNRCHERPTLEQYASRFPAHVQYFSDLFKSAAESVLGESPDRQVGSTAHYKEAATPFDHQASTVEPKGRGTGELLPSVESQPCGHRFGDYELISEIARGGMGVVYKARQVSLNRVVAVKMILSGQLAGEADVQRFRREAEAAANLQHPNIVGIHEVGEHDGQHYFSMEYVEGKSLAAMVRESPLPGKRAARYMKAVAEAIQYAHDRGVLHRDLKPSNILLQDSGARDQEPNVSRAVKRVQGESRALTRDSRLLTPRITDFGLAKRIEGGTELTVTGQMLGTPSYMPPEQASGEKGQIGPASDVYSLGATLYDLLTGRPPFRADTPLDTVLQVLESEPVSLRLLNPKIHRDLETITLKSLQKEPSNRYASAQELADDLGRYLNGEPIRARPTGNVERLWRWANRNPRVATLSAAVLLLLVTIAVGSSVGAMVINGHRLQAEQAATRERNANSQLARANTDLKQANESERIAKQDADQKRIDAENARDETKQVLDYLVATFRKSDPDADGESLTVAALLGEAVEQLDTTFPNQPLIQAQMLNAIGKTYRGLGLHQKAVAVFERAKDLRRDELGDDHVDTLTSMNNLAGAYQHAGRLSEALLLFERTLDLQNAKLGPEHWATLKSMDDLANAYYSAGRLTESLSLHARALELMKAKLGPEHPQTLVSMGGLALAYRSAGELDQALPLFEKTLELVKAKRGPEHSDTLTSMDNLARTYQSVGRLAEALPLFEQTLGLRKSKFGPEHPQTLVSMNNLAEAYRSGGRIQEALQLNKQTLELMKAKLGPEHPMTLASMNSLALAHYSAGKLTEALPLWKETLELMKAKLGPEHPDTLTTMNNLAVAYKSAGRMTEALPLYEETLELRKAKLGPEHPDTLQSTNNLAKAYESARRLAEALPLYEQTLELMKAKLGPEHPDTLGVMGNLAKAYLVDEQPEKALPMFDRFIAGQRARATADDTTFAGLLAAVSLDLLQHRQYSAAETYLRECLTIREKTGADAWTTFNTKSLLGGSLQGQNNYADAEPLLLDGYKGMKEREAKIPPEGRSRLMEDLERLVQLYDAWSKPDEAAAWRKKLQELKTTKNKPMD